MFQCCAEHGYVIIASFVADCSVVYMSIEGIFMCVYPEICGHGAMFPCLLLFIEVGNTYASQWMPGCLEAANDNKAMPCLLFHLLPF